MGTKIGMGDHSHGVAEVDFGHVVVAFSIADAVYP